MVEISTSGKGRAVGLGLWWHFWRPNKGAGMCFTFALALMADKPWFMVVAEHWAQAAELWGTLVFEGHHCSILSVGELGTEKGALVHQQLGLQEILGFQAFHGGRNLCKVSGQLWDSRARNCTTSDVQKKYPQKERVRETSGTTEMATLKKQALKIEAEAWTCQSAVRC